MIPPGVTLYILRHGQTEHNIERRLTGHGHSPLTELGRAQARKNGAILRRIEPGVESFDFVASPILRAIQSMELVREGAGLPSQGYRTDDRIKEIDVGDWCGLSMAEAKERMPHLVAAYEADPWNYARGGMENFAMVHARVKEFCMGLERSAVIVSHMHPTRMFRSLALNLSPKETIKLSVPNLGVIRLRAGSYEFFED